MRAGLTDLACEVSRFVHHQGLGPPAATGNAIIAQRVRISACEALFERDNESPGATAATQNFKRRLFPRIIDREDPQLRLDGTFQSQASSRRLARLAKMSRFPCWTE